MEAGELNFSIANNSTLLVLGNGFDIDLGYPTSYSEFVNSSDDSGQPFFPFKRKDVAFHDLGDYILKATTINKWYDLENILAVYGSRTSRAGYHKDIINNDKDDYCHLVSSLYNYLKSLDLSRPKRESVAARILKVAHSILMPPITYSFNYTDLSIIGKALDLDIDDAKHIHGSISEDDIILGVGDYTKLSLIDDFMYKTSNSQYHSTNLFHDLDSCDTLLIFGLSLSKVDYPYFEDFFGRIASGQYGVDKKKYIRVFTYDDTSRVEILRNLRRMNKGMIPLWGYADFDIVRTKDNVDEDKVTAIVDKLENMCEIDV